MAALSIVVGYWPDYSQRNHVAVAVDLACLNVVNAAHFYEEVRNCERGL